MTEIKAGKELDVAVAKAIGWTATVQVGYRDSVTGETVQSDYWTLLATREPVYKEVDADTGAEYVPVYSTDLNAAFAAANRVRPRVWMFELRQQEDGCFAMFSAPEGDGFASVVQEQGETLPLAACAAILKLKESIEA